MEEKNVDCVAQGLMKVTAHNVYELMESGELRFAKIGKARWIPRRAVAGFSREYSGNCQNSEKLGEISNRV
jgi:excisionase family DNA binding protein